MIEISKDDSALNCRLSGRLDTAACPEVEQAVEKELAGDSQSLVFDMADVDYISSAFLRVCVKMAKRLQDGFSLVNVQPSVKKIFKIAGMDSILDIS